MKVFIGWSGERSQAVAEALRDWLPLVLHYVDPWLSEADIEAGERWAEAVAKELEASNFGIICITQDNVGSPWILFEAGALAKSLQGSRVIPLLLDLDFRDVTGPLAQFQAKKVAKTGLSEVIHSINQVETNPVPETRVKELLDALWPQFEKRVGSIPKQATTAKHSRPQNEILEELVGSVRTLESRFREVVDDSPRSGRFRRLRFHPMMIAELTHIVGQGPDDPIGLLLLASMIREETPWLYELGLEAYRAAKAGRGNEAQDALQAFKRGAEVFAHGPFVRESGIDPMVFEMLSHEMDRFLPTSEPDETGPRPRRRREPSESSS